MPRDSSSLSCTESPIHSLSSLVVVASVCHKHAIQFVPRSDARSCTCAATRCSPWPCTDSSCSSSLLHSSQNACSARATSGNANYGHTPATPLRQMRQVEGVHLARKIERVPCALARPTPPTVSADRFDVRDLVEPVVDKRLVEVGDGVVSPHQQIGFLVDVLPTRVLVRGREVRCHQIQPPVIGNIVVREQILLLRRALMDLRALLQVFDGEGNAMDHSTSQRSASAPRVHLLRQRAVGDGPARVEPRWNYHGSLGVLPDHRRQSQEDFVGLVCG